MKNLLILLLLFPAWAMAQPAQPVKTNSGQPLSVSVTNGNGIQAMSILQLAREGRIISVASPSIATVANTPTSVTVNHAASLGGAAFAILPGRAYYVTSVTGSSNVGPVEFSGAFGLDKPFGAFQGQQLQSFAFVIPNGGGSTTFSPNILLFGEGSMTVASKWLGANNTVIPYSHAFFSGIDITADFNWSAKRVILAVGESTLWGTMGNDPSGIMYPGDSLVTFQLVRELNKEGKSVRHINKAFGGASSQNIAYAQRSGYLDVNYDLLLYNAIHNDKAANTSEATYKANLKSIIDHRNSHNPKASILFISDYPQDVITDARNVNYRTWMQQVATGGSFGGGESNRVYYLDCSDSFVLNATPANDLNMTERTTGTRLHQSGLGQGIIFRTKILPKIKETEFYRNKNNWN